MSLVDDYVEMLTTPTPKNQNAIVKGGKTVQSFIVPFESSLIDFLVITYTQCDKIVMRKLLSDVDVRPANESSEEIDQTSLITYYINETESMRFKAGKKVTVQIKVNLYDEDIPSNTPETSKMFQLDVIEQLDYAIVSTEQDEVNAVEVFNVGRELQALNFYDLVTKNNNLKCRFLLDSFWRGYDLTAVFKDEYGTVARIPLTEHDYCYIPDGVLTKPGKIYVGVETEDISSEDERYTSKWSNSLKVRVGCYEFKEKPAPTPSSSNIVGTGQVDYMTI